MNASNDKTMLTAIFERYETTIKETVEQAAYFRDVRLRDGGLVRKTLKLSPEATKNIQGYLTLGEYVAFLADVQFKDIEFQYPHGIVKE